MFKDQPAVSIVEFGMGNLFSVKKACEYAGFEAKITAEKRSILESDAVILPGVGAFGDAMENLAKLDLLEPLKDYILSNRPFMGICLGMQLLMSESEEFGFHKGMGIFEGNVVKFALPGKRIKIPHVGWNIIRENNAVCPGAGWKDSYLDSLRKNVYMYFVHSFYVVPSSKNIVLSKTNYEGIEFCSSLQKGNIFACQFHPEKSAENGLQVYKNFHYCSLQYKKCSLNK